ncbi:MAG: arylsulfatase [Planctomycetota bacterium]
MNRSRLGFSCSLLCQFLLFQVALAFGATARTAASERPPNIILVMTDDQGYGDLGCHGHPFLKTPNLDRLYSQSTRFTDFHVSPTCAPTRSALMSGRAPFKNGITHTILERDRMALDSTTIAQVLSSAGYSTGIFGKWHLGDEAAYQPDRRGFDETFIHGAGGIGQEYLGSQSDAPGTGYFNPIIKHNGTFVQTEGYCTDVFFRQALGWIKQQSETPDKPFFAYIPTNAPHGPFIVDESYWKPFAGKGNKQVASFLGMIVNIDENMGLLMEKMDAWDLTENTLLIFMTDNGSARGAKIFNAGMRGSKGLVHQGGARVPLFMRLPGTTTAGVDVDRLTRHYDLFPTLAEVAGATIPESVELDGRSLLPLIENPKTDWPDREVFFHAGRWNKAGAPGRWGQGNTDPDQAKYKNFAVRNQRWRLVGDALFDIQNDPGETKDVSADHPEVAAKQRAAIDAWWTEVRPRLINEDAPLDVGKPFRDGFLKQQETSGIPKWTAPEI